MPSFQPRPLNPAPRAHLARWGLALLVALVTACCSAAEPAPASWGSLEPGRFAVGFEAFTVYDHSRPFSAGEPRARPLEISLWYPAERTSAHDERMAFGDLVRLIGREPGEAGSDPWQTLTGLLVPDFLPAVEPEALERLAAVPMAAIADAPPAAGHHPLLLWAKGETAHAVDHAVLSELLASHGFVIASTPSLPSHERRLKRHDAVSLEAQRRDLELTIQTLHGRSFIDADRIGLLAWSFGGLAATDLALRNPEVAAIVSLDSRIGFRSPPEVLASIRDYDPVRITASVLHLTGSGEPRADRLKSFELLDGLVSADTYRATLTGLRHRDFNFVWAGLPSAAGLGGDWPVAPEMASQRIATLTLDFLRGTLLGDRLRESSLRETLASSRMEGVADGSFRPRQPAPPTPDDFLWALEHEGVPAARALFRQSRQTHPEAELFEPGDLLRRARARMRAGAVDGAIALAELTAEAYPTSGMAHYLLAQMAGEGEAARRHYEKSLEVLAEDATLRDAERALLTEDIQRRLAAEPSSGPPGGA